MILLCVFVFVNVQCPVTASKSKAESLNECSNALTCLRHFSEGLCGFIVVCVVRNDDLCVAPVIVQPYFDDRPFIS